MSQSVPSIASWSENGTPAAFDDAGIIEASAQFRENAYVLQHALSGHRGVGVGGDLGDSGHQVLGVLPPIYPEWLGDRGFCESHGLRFPYIAGAMANGIATEEIVIEMAKAGMMGFFGSAGLSIERVEQAIVRLQEELGADQLPFGMNLIHSPHEPDLEWDVVDRYLRFGISRVSASAYMELTPMVVRYTAAGLSRGPSGEVQRSTHLFAKISRPEVAEKFMRPAPKAILDLLVSRGEISSEQAQLAALVPVAEVLTVEADSGGHTDNQALTAVFSAIAAKRDDVMREQTYSSPIHLGAAGGLGTPKAVAAAFAMGAAYVLTGSVNQSAIESGLSDDGKKLLANVDLNDVVMAPAADMFEMGVNVQVLKRGSLFGARAQKLYDVYKTYASMDEIPDDIRQKLEKDIFRQSLTEAWSATASFFEIRNPKELERANRDAKHKMALVFRSYLGQSSKWAIAGLPDRKLDFQIWCGPAMGAFNAWVKGSVLEASENRSVVQIALNLLEGAAQITRADQLRTSGIPVPAAAFQFIPRSLA